MSYIVEGRYFSTREAAFRYHRAEGFVCGVLRCKHCIYFGDSIASPFADPDHLECPLCHKMAAVIEAEVEP